MKHTTKAHSLLLVFLGLVFIAPFSHADLLEYKITNPDGQQRVVKPNAGFVNATGPITFSLGAGVDRKVKISILKSSGEIVSTKTSQLLGATDRISTSEGKEYYGANLVLPAPSDGNYILKNEVLSGSDQVVSSIQESLVIHTVKPTVGDFAASSTTAKGATDNFASEYGKPLISIKGFQSFKLKNVSSSIEVLRADYELKNGNQVISTGSAPFSNGEINFPSSMLPTNIQAELTLNANVIDKAGNSTATQFSFFYDHVAANSQYGAPEIIAVYNPATFSGKNLTSGFKVEGYVDFTTGMTIQENPVRVIIKINKNNHINYTKYGLGVLWYNSTQMGTEVVYEDSDYVYLKSDPSRDLIVSEVGQNTIAMSNYDLMINGLTITENFIASPQTKLGPTLVNSTFQYSDGTESNEYQYFGLSKKDVKLTGVKIEVAPRSYPQNIELTSSKVGRTIVTVPAGQSIATFNYDLHFYNYYVNGDKNYHRFQLRIKGLDEGSSFYTSTYIINDLHYDFEAPSITNVSYLPNENVVSVDSYETEADFYTNNSHQAYFLAIFSQSTAEMLNSNNEWISLSRKNEVVDGWWNRTFNFNTSSIPEGRYTSIRVAVVDRYQNIRNATKTGTFYVDRTAPTINIQSNSEISSLDEIKILLADTLDNSPSVASVVISGGPVGESINLTSVRDSGNQFRLEYPIMFPSLNEGENYKLTVTASDANGNKRTVEKSFSYKPRQINLADGMNGTINIPSVTQEILRNNGQPVIQTEPLTLGDGSVVSGTYDVYASLRSDSKVPLVINGIRIDPGQTMTIMSKLNFANTGGRLSISAYPAVKDVVGNSYVLITTAAPNAPILQVTTNTWKGSAKLSSDSWNVRQVIDTIKITATQDSESGSVCRLTTKESEAKSADPIRDPVCLIEWDSKPDEAAATSPVAGLVGQAVAVGIQPVSYSMYLYSGGTNKIKVGNGSQDLTVLSAVGSIGYQVAENFSPVSRSIQLINASLKQTIGNDCTLTISAERAKTDAANKAVGSTSRTCVLEWIELPEGLTQVTTTDTPKLNGFMATNGTFPITWRVSVFSKNGTRITLNDQTLNVNVVDPQAPSIEMITKYLFKDNIYVVPMTGGYFADALVTSVNADLNIDVTRNGDSILSEKYGAGSSNTNKIYRRVTTDDRKLWEETNYKVSAVFSKLTDVKTDATYRVISAPAESVKPVVEVNGTSAIDTEVLPVTVNIRDQYKPNDAYNKDTMGVWKVRLISQKSFNEVEALSDFVEATNGTASFNADLSNVSASYVRIAAEAVLESPIEGYERKVISTRPAFMTVLRGGEIGADVTARRISGAAPFTTVFKLALTDRQDYRAAGSIIWETSTDGGNSWSEYVPDERYKYQLVKTFDKGQYLVRAKVVNANSGAEAYTAQVEVIAYNQPQITVNGPTTLFIGQEYTYTADVLMNKVPVSADGVTIDWSVDGGISYTQSGSSLSLVKGEEGRVRLWTRVRDTDAPEDDPYAYKIVKSAVEVKGVKAPRTYVTGPNVIETGKTYVFKANVQLPYRGMDAQLGGFFTLPDGTTVEGDTIEYTPSNEDLAKNSINTMYTAWIEGYRDQGAESTYSLKSRVWEYVWPKFSMQVRKTADVAPATITAVVRPVAFNGKLEEPTYEWIIPDGVAVEKSSQPTATAFVVNEPGEYLLKVIVRDARGNESVVEQVLVIGEAAAYVIDLQYSASNTKMREPLDVLLRPYISGGHPRDRISERTYSVDGTNLSSTGIYGRANLMAGDHKVKLKIQSEMGHEVEKEVTIAVAKNQTPTCSVTSRETVSSLLVYAQCKDPDGRIKSYEWTVNGEKLSISSERITINKAAGESNPSVSLIGVDDSGGKSESVSL